MFSRFASTLALLLAATLNAHSLYQGSAQGGSVQNAAPAASQQFHGTYEELNPTQKKLIDDWYAEYNQLTHDNSKPTEYNQFSVSTRTTFEGVTHALMTTKLTDK